MVTKCSNQKLKLNSQNSSVTRTDILLFNGIKPNLKSQNSNVKSTHTLILSVMELDLKSQISIFEGALMLSVTWLS